MDAGNNQTRKEKLALYKQQKLLKENAKMKKTSTGSAPVGTGRAPRAVAGSVKSKVHMAAAKSSVFQSNTRKSAVNDRNVVNAGKKKIAATTPIGKLQARIRSQNSANLSKPSKVVEAPVNKNLFGSDDVPAATCTADFNKIIEMKLDEADYLSTKHGCQVARAYLEELPKDDECAHLELLSRAMYWLAWIKIEKEAHQWERVEKLFIQASSLVRSTIDKKVIAAAYAEFREEADKALECTLNSIDDKDEKVTVKPPAVPSYIPKSNSTLNLKRKLDEFKKVDCFENPEDEDGTTDDQESLSANAFKRVNVSSTRQKFEVGSFCEKEQRAQESIKIGEVNVKSLANTLQSNLAKSCIPGKQLAGAVALPGVMQRTKSFDSKRQQSPSTENYAADTLNSLLGLSTDDCDSENQGGEKAIDAKEDIEANIMDQKQHEAAETVPEPNEGPLKSKLKRQCRNRAPVRISQKNDDIFSDDSEDEKENVQNALTNVPIQQAESLKSETVGEISTARRTRSGVCFAPANFSTPSKNTPQKSKKRKATPFKPHVDDLVISPEKHNA